MKSKTMEEEQEGYRKSLQKKTLPELFELLQRQEKLLLQKKFLTNLPDGGIKIKNFVQTIQQIISERQQDSHGHKNFECSKFEGLPQHELPVSDMLSAASSEMLIDENSSGDRTVASHREKIQSASTMKSSPDQESFTDRAGEAYDAVAKIDECMNNLMITESAAPREVSSFSTSNENLEPPNRIYPNSYEKVMKRSKMNDFQRAPFKPSRMLSQHIDKTFTLHCISQAFHRRVIPNQCLKVHAQSLCSSKVLKCVSLQIDDIQQLPDKYKQRSRPMDTSPLTSLTNVDSPKTGHTEAGQQKKNVKHQEESAVPGPEYKFKGAKEISVEESILLQSEQKKQVAKLQTLHAAERLAEQLDIKTVDYKSAAFDMNYRSNGLMTVDDDSDDNTDEDEDALE